MTSIDTLRQLGVLDARAPRYTSYPPANHFSSKVTQEVVRGWMSAIPPGSRVSLYVHVPYCRNLCWFCACRTQGTSTDRPLAPYLELLKAEMAQVAAALPDDVAVSHVHLGGGTPTILPPDLLDALCHELRAVRRWTDDAEFSVEIDPTEIDLARLEVLARHGMTRASIGVQDFDPMVQESIGRIQPYDLTRDVVAMIRAQGVHSLNMDILYGLPHQTGARLAASVQQVMALNPDRIALFGYAHVPWMAKRQVMIPTGALPDAEARLELFDTARDLLTWDGYRMIGIDHFARPGDRLAEAVSARTLRRNFQGYTDDPSGVLIGMGASAISQYPQGYAQNEPTSSRYAKAIGEGALATVKGHTFSEDDLLRHAMIEDIMCRFELDLDRIAERFGKSAAALWPLTERLRRRFAGNLDVSGHRIRINKDGVYIARLVAQELDAYAMPEGRHSRAL